MNKYSFRYIWFLAGIFGIFSSCNDDFLNRTPIINISDGNFWRSANDLMMYANNFYNQNGLLPRYTDWGTIGPYGVDADNGSDAQIVYNYNTRMNSEGTIPSSGGGWTASDWSLLRDINYFMDNYTKVNEPWDLVKQYVGEALFFRSTFYFTKLRSFGDLPWASTTVLMDSKILFESRLPRNQVVDSIMHDLDRAIEYLPERTTNWTGRLTKETAMLLQARIALYEGTWEKYHAIKNTDFKVTGSDGSKFIKKAADVSGALMALAQKNGNTALVDGKGKGYTNLFNQKDYSSNREVMLWRKFSIEDKQSTHWVGYDGAGRGMTKGLVDSYLCTDGQPIAVSNLYKGDNTLKDVVANRDPRLNQTMCVDDGAHIRWIQDNTFFTTPVFEGVPANNCPTGYQLYKGYNYDYSELLASMSTIGVIYFRYAEALLIYAEARAELGSITQTDIDNTINALRKRVGMDNGLLDMNNITTDPNWEFKSISPLLNEIRRERKVELACEGYRVDDIFRWAAADELIVGKTPKGAIKAQWENYPNASDAFKTAWGKLKIDSQGYIDPYQGFSAMNEGYKFNLKRDYLLPIPSTELTLNPKLAQNPGW